MEPSFTVLPSKEGAPMFGLNEVELPDDCLGRSSRGVRVFPNMIDVFHNWRWLSNRKGQSMVGGMPKFEYVVVRVPQLSPDHEDVLNDLGKQGWELLFELDDGLPTHTFVFKRPLP
jgi:hypothetical protein